MKLSILIPQYNEKEEQVKNLLDSIALQQNIDFNEIEVIMVNDCSDVILSEEFVDSYPFTVNYYLLEEHKGVSAVRDICYQYSTGEYVMFCDADDMFIDGRGLFWIFQDIKKGFDCFISYFVEEVRDQNNNIVYIEHKEQDGTFVHGKVFNKEFLNTFNIKWNEKLTVHEDSFFVFQALSCAREGRLKLCLKPFYLWRWNSGSVSRKSPDYIGKTYDKMIDSSEELALAFSRKGMIQQAKEIVVKTIFDSYLVLNQKRFFTFNNEEDKERIFKRIQKFYQDNKQYYFALDEEKRNNIYMELRNRKFREGLIFEEITFNDWFKSLNEEVV